MKMSRYFFAPLIVVLGLALWTITSHVRADVQEKDSFEIWVQDVTADYGHTFEHKWVLPDSLDFDFENTVERTNITPELVGFVPVYSSEVVCVLGPSFSCRNLPHGYSLFQSSTDKNSFLAISYAYKVSLKGCSPKLVSAIQSILKD